jgi:hypothetical protein
MNEAAAGSRRGFLAAAKHLLGSVRDIQGRTSLQSDTTSPPAKGPMKGTSLWHFLALRMPKLHCDQRKRMALADLHIGGSPVVGIGSC